MVLAHENNHYRELNVSQEESDEPESIICTAKALELLALKTLRDPRLPEEDRAAMEMAIRAARNIQKRLSLPEVKL